MNVISAVGGLIGLIAPFTYPGAAFAQDTRKVTEPAV